MKGTEMATRAPQIRNKSTCDKSIDLVIGARIRYARLERGMSQTDLASKIGVSFQQVQKYERGHSSIFASRLVMVAEAMYMDPADFMSDVRSHQMDSISSIGMAQLINELPTKTIMSLREIITQLATGCK
jgi:transcriptional regulator with XRE-family HTH domain